jgi:hypothetical protein
VLVPPGAVSLLESVAVLPVVGAVVDADPSLPIDASR